ncbi:hypothetical protein IC582_002587 [Cucumis melo]|uniref:Homeobox-leucine zipper protein GLABRA 2 n=1 Tax=Cucumis melo TaxID=3656 RepID=A0A1S3CGV0_CUCME|nr:homeobox-leucine zipper protein GLABRA 2 [Cucumis melo]
MAVVMSDNHASRRLKTLPSSPALSLTLAGVFENAGPMDVEADTTGRRDDSCSDNSEPAGSRSAEDLGVDPDDEDEDKLQGNTKKRKNRHTSEQIREMEMLFKESPHPDEKQRQQLSEKLGLSCKQIKFWFQNRRTQIKAIHERHENALLKGEMEKLREENQAMREMISKSSCPKGCCSASTNSLDPVFNTSDQQQQQLVTEIARLKAEVERLRTALDKYAPAETENSKEEGGIERGRNLEKSKSILGLEKGRVMLIGKRAIEEVVKMGDSEEPLWVRSVETGRELLNYDVYRKELAVGNERGKREVEASRETGVVFADLHRLVQSFMDVVQWKEMFPSMISKASTMEVVFNGDGNNRDGAVQLMFAELQMLTPTIPPREIFFVRSCKQLSPGKWVVADVSIDKVGDHLDSSSASRCRKRPSGCIIQDTSDGHCKVTWVEHWECHKIIGLHTIYRTIVNSGLIFGATHWMSTLQMHCEWQVFFMATNVPMKDSTGITTVGGRKSVLRLAQRMTSSIYQAIGASSSHTWTKVQSKIGETIRIASRKNLKNPHEPTGLILCAVASVWLPVSPKILFEFLIDEARRPEWDVMLSGGQVEMLANFAKGQNRGNAVTIQAIKSDESNKWILQDSLTNEYESTVVYAEVDMNSMKSVMAGFDSGNITTLPTGFSILPDGHPTRPLVISSSKEERETGGSLLTVASQILVSPSPTAETTSQSVEYVNNIISHTLENIKASLQGEDD